MNVVLRVDASVAIGSGHLMRCLALAEEVRARGGRASLLMATCPMPLRPLVSATGAELIDLPPSDVEITDAAASAKALRTLPAADWGVVDHYGLGLDWEQAMNTALPRLLVIDDLANRAHDSLLLLDQNLWRAPETRYRGLLRPGCRTLLGPHYALLRREFVAAGAAPEPAGDGPRLLASFGGTDPTGETLKFLDALPRLTAAVPAVDLVVGAAHPALDAVRVRAAARPQVQLHVQTREIARLLRRATLAVGAGGSSHWERLYLGVPTLCTAVADNQVEACELLHERGAVRYLGRAAAVDADGYAKAIDALLSDPTGRAAQSAAGRAIMGGGSGTARVVDAMQALMD